MIKKKCIYNIRIIKNYTSYNNDDSNNNKFRIMNSLSNNNRNIDFHNVDTKNNKVIHPITLKLIDTDNKPLCLTKFNYKNNKIEFINNYNCSQTTDKYKDYLLIPPIGLSYYDLLNIYGINSIEQLIESIDKLLNLKPQIRIYTIDRIIICWIKTNFNHFISQLKYIANIIFMIFNKISSFEIKETFKDTTIKELTANLEKWYRDNPDFVEKGEIFIKTIYNMIINK